MLIRLGTVVTITIVAIMLSGILVARAEFFLSIGPLKPLTALKAPPRGNAPQVRMKPVGTGLMLRDRAFLKSRHVVRVFAYAPPGDHEAAGIMNSGGGFITGVQALHSVYLPNAFNLQLPAAARDDQTLYAPTTRPPNGSCIEVGTAYRHPPNSTQTLATVYAYDFCGPEGRFAVEAVVDESFLLNYAAASSANGHAEYAVAITADSAVVTKNTLWRAYLYSFSRQRWELFYSAKGAFTDDIRGWSIFETWFQPGQCSPNLPQIEVKALAYYDGSSGSWYLAPKQSGDESPGSDCFDGADRSYNFVRSAGGWSVTSTGN